ncbi:TolC family protein [Deferribacter autotrophicus]|uniref:TolC family protein n=1 Tax=Deferribacter autotrophicus TaxID=500465 RepID=A0A5A8F5P4_9BACT|nr:TolC family protein [Deferribacter autotrophicus]KAA0258034.1 TolC family protein [Deferribacter autotrophicus]
MKKYKKYLILPLFIFLSLNNIYALTLDEAVNKALKNNFYLLSKEKELNSKKYEINAADAAKYPSLFFNATYTLLDEKKTQPFTTPFFSQEITMSEKEYFDIFTGLKLNLYTGGLITSNIKIKKLEYESAKSMLSEEQLNIIFNTKKAYLDILRLYANKKIAEDYIKSLTRHLHDVKLMYDQGLVPYIDILQTEVKLSEAKQKLTIVTNNIKVAKSHLSTLMGEKLNDSYQVESISYKIPDKLLINHLYSIAEKNRPILQSLKTQIKLADQMVTATKSQFKPKIYLLGGYKYSDMLENVDPKGNFLIQAGISFNLDWNKPFKETEAKKEIKYAIIKNKEDIKLKVLLEVKKAIEDLNSAEDNLKVAKDAVAKAKEYHRILNLKYKEGLANNSDLLDAEAMLTEALMREKNAYYDIIEKYFAIEKAIGKELR